MNEPNGETIPFETATRICSDLRREKGVKLFSQCWGCMRFSKGDPMKMCFSDKSDNRGCSKVNEAYGRQQ